MTNHQNIHPCMRWESVEARDNGLDGGSCVVLILSDTKGNKQQLCIHYWEDRENFIKMLKTAVAEISGAGLTAS